MPVLPDSDPECSHIPPSQTEIMRSVWERPRPTPTPNRGERVLYRAVEFGDVIDALVVAVRDPRDAYADPYVWRRDCVTGVPTSMLPDPWVELIVDTGDGVLHSCREGRVRGAPGWLPPAWDPPPAEPEHLMAMAAGFILPGRG